MFLRRLPQFSFLRNYHQRNNKSDIPNLFKTVEKRSTMLNKLIKNRDKRKSWHFELNVDTAVNTKNLFHKIHQPCRRVNVLNALFMRNITDVLSTECIIPGIYDHGIQITRVKVSSDFTILNVFWQVPEPSVSKIAELQIKLSIGSPKVRSELINRNVLGKVPRIYFNYDKDNQHSASYVDNSVVFESSLEDTIDEGPLTSFEDLPENIFKFSDYKRTIRECKKENATEENTKSDPKATLQMPVIPQDMKTDVFGLEHEKIMHKILTLRRRDNSPLLNVTDSECDSNNLVSLTSSNVVQKNHSQVENTSSILKKFCALRKTERIEAQKHRYSQKLEFREPYEDMSDDFESIDFDEEPYDQYSNDVMYSGYEDDQC